MSGLLAPASLYFFLLLPLIFYSSYAFLLLFITSFVSTSSVCFFLYLPLFTRVTLMYLILKTSSTAYYPTISSLAYFPSLVSVSFLSSNVFLLILLYLLITSCLSVSIFFGSSTNFFFSCFLFYLYVFPHTFILSLFFPRLLFFYA